MKSNSVIAIVAAATAAVIGFVVGRAHGHVKGVEAAVSGPVQDLLASFGKKGPGHYQQHGQLQNLQSQMNAAKGHNVTQQSIAQQMADNKRRANAGRGGGDIHYQHPATLQASDGSVFDVSGLTNDQFKAIENMIANSEHVYKIQQMIDVFNSLNGHV